MPRCTILPDRDGTGSRSQWFAGLLLSVNGLFGLEQLLTLKKVYRTKWAKHMEANSIFRLEIIWSEVNKGFIILLVV